MKTPRKAKTPSQSPSPASIRRGRDVIQMEIEGLQKVQLSLASGFTRAVEMILQATQAGGKVVVTGVGKNLHIGEKISATLASTGSTSVFLNPIQAMHGDLGILAPADVLLALSYSGESEEILNLLPLVRRLGIKVISLTGKLHSSMAKLSDEVISVAVEREACPFNMAPTTSTTATLAVGDALAMVLLDARGFRIEDYARRHPAGSIGRTLLLRVSDIMRKGDRVASVPSDAKIKDVIFAMTKGRTGSAGVLDKAGRVLGIFTDGDLRRHLPQHPDIVNMPVASLMTRNPISVKADCLAADVLRIFEKHNIDDLLVVDDRNKLVGAVDIQDLPKFKIM
ncbi:MAG: KpsF/GutQ family sugar-phosphate isomerase [bacterium]